MLIFLCFNNVISLPRTRDVSRKKAEEFEKGTKITNQVTLYLFLTYMIQIHVIDCLNLHSICKSCKTFFAVSESFANIFAANHYLSYGCYNHIEIWIMLGRKH